MANEENEPVIWQVFRDFPPPVDLFENLLWIFSAWAGKLDFRQDISRWRLAVR